MEGKLLRLVQSLDPLFPIGSYTLSNGMETYVQKNLVKSGEDLEKHLKSYLYMLSYNDLAFAAKACSGTDVIQLDELCGALKSPYEMRSGSIKQCARFLKLQTELDRYPSLEQYRNLIREGTCEGHYSIAVGLFIRETEIPVQTALELYAYSILSSMANHAAKLIPLRQLDGQRALQEACKGIGDAVKTAIEAGVEDLGASGCAFDIRSMQHEKLYSRLYIS